MKKLTEAEAKTKWCPMASDKTAYHCCVASACMMWRSSEDEFEECETDLGQLPRDYHTSAPQWRQIDRGDSWGLRWQRKVSDGGGYCGLAGAP